MSEKIRLDRKIGFQNMFYTKSINVIIYLNAKVSQPFYICVFFSVVHVRIFI